jgi:hypothetical protein
MFLTSASPVLAGDLRDAARDIELTRDGSLYGEVCSSEGLAVANAAVTLRYQGSEIASATTDAEGHFLITGVRGGAHEMTVGSLAVPVRLWKNGTAPEAAAETLVVAADEHVVRGQQCDQYCAPGCPPTSGFGLIDVVTLAMLATSTAALIIAIDTNDKVDDLPAQPVSP